MQNRFHKIYKAPPKPWKTEKIAKANAEYRVSEHPAENNSVGSRKNIKSIVKTNKNILQYFNNIGENCLTAVAGGNRNLSRKIHSVVLAALSLFPTIPLPTTSAYRSNIRQMVASAQVSGGGAQNLGEAGKQKKRSVLAENMVKAAVGIGATALLCGILYNAKKATNSSDSQKVDVPKPVLTPRTPDASMINTDTAQKPTTSDSPKDMPSLALVKYVDPAARFMPKKPNDNQASSEDLFHIEFNETAAPIYQQNSDPFELVYSRKPSATLPMRKLIPSGGKLGALALMPPPPKESICNRLALIPIKQPIPLYTAQAASLSYTNASGLPKIDPKNMFLLPRYLKWDEPLHINNNVALVEAAKNNDIDTLIRLLNQGFYINSRDNCGKTALMEAAFHGNNAIVDELLKRGANVDAHDSSGWTALMWAVVCEHKDIASKLLEKSNNLDAQLQYGGTALTWAMTNGDKKTVIELLRKNVDVDVRDMMGRTPLMQAIESKHEEDIISRLIGDEYADVNECDIHGKTALMVAAENGFTQLAVKLLEAHADINKQDENGKTALMYAIENGHTETAEMLSDNPKADINIADKNNETALTYAIEYNLTSVIEKLLSLPETNINSQNTHGITPLISAIYHNDLGTVNKLLENQRVNINIEDKKGWTALISAAYCGHTPLIKTLLEHGANLNHTSDHDETALICALKYKANIESAKELLNAPGVIIDTVDKNGMSALMYAAQHGSTEIVEQLISRGAKINVQNRYGDTALMLAVKGNHLEIVKKLLDNGADVNIAADSGHTALIYAAIYNEEPEIAKVLLDHGADVNATLKKIQATAFTFAIQHKHLEIACLLLNQTKVKLDHKINQFGWAWCISVKNGYTDVLESLLAKNRDAIHLRTVSTQQTALILAAKNGKTDVVKLLLSKDGIDVNAQDKYGWTALMKAAEKGHREIVDLLLKRDDIDVNAANMYGSTALMIATYGEHAETVESLLKKDDIDINAKNHNGKTALMVAIEKGYHKIVDFLRKNGAH